MLVLTQKVEGRINLIQECCGGHEALGTILIRSIRGNRVSIGLELRKDVRILREELECEEGEDGKP